MPSRCWCCRNSREETICHVFLRSPMAMFLWRYFCAPAWINIEGKQLVQVINEGWRRPGNTSLSIVYQAIPSLIVWNLWKRRNSGMHGKTVSITRLIFQVSNDLYMLLKFRRIAFSGITVNWPDLHDKLEHHIPRLKYTRVLWQLPHVGWLKCNNDGACRDATVRASYVFCIRDGIGDLIYAQKRRFFMLQTT